MSLLTSEDWIFGGGLNILWNIENDYTFYLNVESGCTFLCIALPKSEGYLTIRSVTKNPNPISSCSFQRKT